MLEQVPSLVWSKEGVAITYDRSNQAGLIPVLLDTEDNIGYMPYRSVLIFTVFYWTKLVLRTVQARRVGRKEADLLSAGPQAGRHHPRAVAAE